MNKEKPNKVRLAYNRLNKHFGDLGWWPAETALEVAIGAILVQNTAWRNVEAAVSNLKKHDLIDVAKMNAIDIALLEELIRPSGCYKQKAIRLKRFSSFLIDEFDGNISRLSDNDIDFTRRKLLQIKGIGPETADCILVYALNKPIFIVDAYTRRIFMRHGIIAVNEKYKAIQAKVSASIKSDIETMNGFHAFLVETGKQFCKKKDANCDICPLKGL